MKMDARGFANVAHDCLANLMACIQSERAGCRGYVPFDGDEDCEGCAFYNEPQWIGDTDYYCSLEHAIYDLERFERQMAKGAKGDENGE